MKGSRAGFADLKALCQTARQARRKAAQLRRAAQAPASDAPTVPTTQDDARAFRRAMQSVTPLAPARRPAQPGTRAAPPAPSPEQLAKRQAAVGLDKHSHTSPPPQAALSDQFVPHALYTGQGVAWHAADQPADTPRRLQRGHWPVTARIDLHGLRLDAARSALAAFIADCASHRVRCARVIHGKGYGSANATPVLREKVPVWLMQHPSVCAFVQAPASEGGAGALIVLLRAVAPPSSP